MTLSWAAPIMNALSSSDLMMRCQCSGMMPLLISTLITLVLMASYHFVRGLPTRLQFARFLLPSGLMETFLMGSSKGDRNMYAN